MKQVQKKISLHIQTEKNIFRFFLGFLVVTILLYMTFINLSIVAAAQKDQLEVSLSTVGSHVATLEAQYFSKIESITLKGGSSLGLSFAQEDPVFVTRNPDVLQVLTLRSF
ncbi:MAG: hypothetical protein COU27_00750 [Candidatus Levybacteria bacterium CG10_big_fil_rev_8_21_14_0_10_36_7]|nr:MAG: hypothetical protein COU27_00750 [Candidatus Levybacteria bacterium CG10_big_fil_rev_8_21_14_0_10_36_7]